MFVFADLRLLIVLKKEAVASNAEWTGEVDAPQVRQASCLIQSGI